MKPVTISFPAEMHDALKSHLLHGRTTEQVAFMLGEPSRSGGLDLRVIDLYLVPSDEVDFGSSCHVRLADDVRGKVIKWAWDRDACLIEAHSHLGWYPASFSPTDLEGLKEFVPHVRWRLRGAPYGALVFTEEDLDGLIWIDDDCPGPIDAVHVEGRASYTPTGLTIERFRRTETGG